MRRRLSRLLCICAFVMTGLLVADIAGQIYVLSGSQKNEASQTSFFYNCLEKITVCAMDSVRPISAYMRRQSETEILSEYYPSKEDLEAIAHENSIALYEDMEGENAEAMRRMESENMADEVSEMNGGQQNEYVETLAGVPSGEIYSKKSLMDYDFLLNHFYLVDPSTSASDTLIDGETLTSEDMSMDLSGDEPKILIYHTHSQETYLDSEEGNPDDTVVGVGSQLTKVLEEKYGVSVYHDLSVYDMQDGKEDRNKAYSQAAVAVQNILDEYPSIEVVIDLHRDGVPDHVHLVTDINGKEAAQIMFLNGLCRDFDGSDYNFSTNPNLESNLAFSLQLQLKAKAYFPDLVRRIYLRAYRYNLHFKARSLLIEVGAQNNTVAEAKNAMEPLADILYAVLSGNGDENGQ